jgi:hemolysin activation/secretion protein
MFGCTALLPHRLILAAIPKIGKGHACAFSVLLAGLYLMPALSARAQQIRLPSGAEPGRAGAQPVLPQAVPQGEGIAVPKSPAIQAPKGAETFSFTLRSVDIEGVTAFSADDLKALYAALLGKTVTVADMFKVASDLEVRYRAAGFVTTRVIVPGQTIDGGHFRIRVIEGFVADIAYPDDIGAAKAALSGLLDPLLGVRPINVADVERQLLLANDLPGLTVKATLEPSATELGGSVIVVHGDRKAFDASLSFDNRNTPYSGSSEWTANAAWNGFGSHADRLSLTAKVSSPFKREWLVLGGYQALLTGGGLTLNLQSSFSRSNPGEELDPLDIRSRVLSEQGTLTYPVIRSRQENLHVFGEFEYRDIDTDLGRAAFNRDKLRIARLGLDYDRADTWDGVTAVRGTIHQGLGLFDATPHGSDLASRADGHSSFTKFTASVTRVQALPDDFSILATATGQISTVPLLASEQLALGGPGFARGYDDGEISGDKGWAGSVELRYSQALAKIVPNGAQFYVYFDGGQVWSESGTPLLNGSTLASLGGGVRINPLDPLFASLEVDKPLDHEVLTQRSKATRVFFSVTARY